MVKSVVKERAEMVTEVGLEARCALASVAVMLTTKVPFVLNIVVKVGAVSTTGEPPSAVQAIVYGAVPPVALPENVSGCPTVPVEGPLIEGTRLSGLMTTLANFVCTLAVGVAESVPVTLMLTVPFTL